MSETPKILWYCDQECSAGPVQFRVGETKYVRADIVDELVKKLEIALHVFRTYQAYHEYRDDFDKADRNKGYADQMESALQLLDEPNTQSLYPDPELKTGLSLQDMCRGDK